MNELLWINGLRRKVYASVDPGQRHRAWRRTLRKIGAGR